MHFQLFSHIFQGFSEFTCFPGEYDRFLSIFWHCQASAFLFAQRCYSFCWKFFDLFDQIYSHMSPGPDAFRFFTQSTPGPRVSLWWSMIQESELGEPVHCLDSIQSPSTYPIIIHLIFLQYVQCCVCPPENVKFLEWDRKRAFLWHFQFLSFLDKIAINEASRFSPEIMFCFQFVLFFLLHCRIWFVRFSVNITAVFFSLFDILPNSVVLVSPPFLPFRKLGRIES